MIDYHELRRRDSYLNKLIGFQDTEPVKVITGIRRCGKSSLLNAVVNRDAAIVSAVAGTTRDAVDVHLDIKGYPVMFTDTAGIREVEEEIEKQGIEIAFRKIADADLSSSADALLLKRSLEENRPSSAVFSNLFA